jgi:RHS repeat-associated protein
MYDYPPQLASSTHKFTGKERDTETGLENFGARYDSSSMGRWLSPERLNLTDTRVTNPANTINKYVYGANNPFRYTDPDGRDIVVLYEQSNYLGGSSAGHVMLFANNPNTESPP